jgi:hypothetical protein
MRFVWWLVTDNETMVRSKASYSSVCRRKQARRWRCSQNANCYGSHDDLGLCNFVNVLIVSSLFGSFDLNVSPILLDLVLNPRLELPRISVPC